MYDCGGKKVEAQCVAIPIAKVITAMQKPVASADHDISLEQTMRFLY